MSPSIQQSELDALLALYGPQVEDIVSRSDGLSARALLDQLTPVVGDLAVDILARESAVISRLSKAKAKTHLNRAQVAVLERILPENIPAGEEHGHHGIFENLPLGEAWALLRIKGFRRRMRAAILGRMREESARMIQKCGGAGHRC
jgi:hypothetical protein